MSTAKVTNLQHESAANPNIVLGADGSVSVGGGNISPQTGFKNRIINGDMRIDQRNAGASGTAVVYTVDRWFYNGSQASKGTWQQNAGSVAPPSGFKNYLGFTSSSAYAVGATDYFGFYQSIEGFNVADLGWGAAGSKSVTLSFQVYSSLTGTFGGSINNSGYSRSYPFTYTISSANTWTTISVTIPGDTAGTWLTNNGIGMTVNFSLGTGSTYSGTSGSWSGSLYLSATGATSVVGTNGATFYITGVQLEKGSVATPFEFRSIGQELALCQRYYEVGQTVDSSGQFWCGYSPGANANYQSVRYMVIKRTTPTVASITQDGAGNYTGTSITYTSNGPDGFRATANTNGTAGWGYFRSSWTSSAEL